MNYFKLLLKITRKIYLFSFAPELSDYFKPPNKAVNLLQINPTALPLIISPREDNLFARLEDIYSNSLHAFGDLIPFKSGCFLKRNNYKHWSKCSSNIFSDYEDIKILWEVNRLEDISTLILAYLADNDVGHLEKAIVISKLWSKENPYNKGVNWFSNMEVALRLNRFLFLLLVIKNTEIKDKELETLVSNHLSHLEADIWFTKHTMGGNHYIIELMSLALFEIATAGKKKKFCNTLRNEAEKQFGNDGGHFEGSIGYHIYILDGLLLVNYFSRLFNKKDVIPKKVILKATYFLTNLQNQNNIVPNIGDWDDGRVFVPVNNPRKILSLLEFAKRLYPNLNITNKSDSSWAVCPNFGLAYTKIKDNINILLRAGNIIHGHTHLDMLSLHAMDNKDDWIIDSGTYSYNKCSKKRIYYRGQHSHSTILITNAPPPVKELRTFSWENLLNISLSKTKNIVSAEYEWPNIGNIKRTVMIENNEIIIQDSWPIKQPASIVFIVPLYNIRIEKATIYVKKNSGTRPITMIIRGDSKNIHQEIVKISTIRYNKHHEAIKLTLYYDSGIGESHVHINWS